MKVLFVLTLLFGLLSGCLNANQFQELGGKISVPPFSITIKLSPKAQEVFTSSKETIMGVVYFDGDGKVEKGVGFEELKGGRDVVLGEFEFELKEAGNLKITNATLSKEAYSRLTDQNYHFTVNVFSGRKKFENNLLSEGFAMGRYEDLKKGMDIVIPCTLIEE